MGDHKSALQEMLQARGSAPPEYEVKAETGPDHRKRFLVEVVIRASTQLPLVIAQGTGTTKKTCRAGGRASGFLAIAGAGCLLHREECYRLSAPAPATPAVPTRHHPQSISCCRSFWTQCAPP